MLRKGTATSQQAHPSTHPPTPAPTCTQRAAPPPSGFCPPACPPSLSPRVEVPPGSSSIVDRCEQRREKERKRERERESPGDDGARLGPLHNTPLCLTITYYCFATHTMHNSLLPFPYRFHTHSLLLSNNGIWAKPSPAQPRRRSLNLSNSRPLPTHVASYRLD